MTLFPIRLLETLRTEPTPYGCWGCPEKYGYDDASQCPDQDISSVAL
jgi:hypothetical protein